MIKEKKTPKERIETEEDYIHCPHSKNSLKNLIQKNPEGIDNERIAKVLMISEQEVEDTFESAISKIRAKLTTGMN